MNGQPEAPQDPLPVSPDPDDALGGPLVDLLGRVVGIVTASSASAEGLGFAIPIETASSLIARAGSAA